MGGGVPMTDLKKLARKQFMFLLKRLGKQKKDENKEMDKMKAKSKSSSGSKGMKYLGK